MKRTLIRALAGAMATVTVVSAIPASAGERYHRHNHRPAAERGIDGGNLLVAGILGLAAGAIAANLVAQSSRSDAPEPVYRNPPHFPRPSPDRDFMVTPVYRAPHPAVPRSYEPWSNEWYRYCAGRYRSFDPDTGTFEGRDGVRRFCVTN